MDNFEHALADDALFFIPPSSHGDDGKPRVLSVDDVRQYHRMSRRAWQACERQSRRIERALRR